MAPQRGFTLVEVVVAITIASIVVAFAALFIAAPVNAYDSEQRRAAIVDEAGAAWPAIEADLKHALPNSLRARRNGANVVLEMLRAEQYSRYIGNPSSASFNVAAPLGAAGNYNMYLSVNNCGAVPPACPDAYTRTVSMTSQRTITITDLALGEQKIDVSAPAPVFGLDSPRRTIYLVSGPVTYLCSETQGTLRRYDRYPVATSQTSWDTPGEFTAAGIVGSIVATGLKSCDFRASPQSAVVPQTASLRLTATRGTGESITMFHAGGSGWLP